MHGAQGIFRESTRMSLAFLSELFSGLAMLAATATGGFGL